MRIILALAALMLTIKSANNGDVYFNPTFKLKYGIIFITLPALTLSFDPGVVFLSLNLHLHFSLKFTNEL